MSNKKTTNLAASVRQKLLNLSRERQETFNCQITPVNVPPNNTQYDPPIYTQTVPPIYRKCATNREPSSANQTIK
jgi:hypothetical protein